MGKSNAECRLTTLQASAIFSHGEGNVPDVRLKDLGHAAPSPCPSACGWGNHAEQLRASAGFLADRGVLVEADTIAERLGVTLTEDEDKAMQPSTPQRGWRNSSKRRSGRRMEDLDPIDIPKAADVEGFMTREAVPPPQNL